MSVKIHPQGGLALATEVAGETLETRISWGERSTYVEITVLTSDPKKTTAVVTLLTNLLGGGLQVEFDQSLLGVAPGCAPGNSREETFRQQIGSLSASILALGAKLGIDFPADLGMGPAYIQQDKAFQVVDHVLTQIGEQVTGAQRDELAAADKLPHGAGPGEYIDATAPPAASIGGVAVGEAPAEQPRRRRRTRAEIEADNAAAEAAKKKPADKPAQQPTKPDPAATAAFQGDMAAIDAKQKAEAPPATVEVRPAAEAAPPVQETRVEPVGDELDEMVELLSNPQLPTDLHPLDFKRNPSDPQYLDTAVVRLNFGYPLVEEYRKDPNFKPGNPPNSPVNMKTDEGVVALARWMHAIAERAAARGKPIGQLDAIFGLGTPEQVFTDMVEKVRKRREAAAQRLAAASK